MKFVVQTGKRHLSNSSKFRSEDSLKIIIKPFV